MSRVTLFHPFFKTRGGAEFLCANHARRIATRGHQVQLVTYRFDGEIWEDELPDIDVRVVPKHTWTDALFCWNRRSKLVARARRARSALSDGDVVVAHNAPCNLLLGAVDLPGRTVWQCNEPPRHLHRDLANPNLARRANSPIKAPLDAATRHWRQATRELESSGRARKTRLGAQQDIQLTRKLDTLYAISEFSRDNARAIYGHCEEDVVYPFVRFPEGNRKSGAIPGDNLQVLVHTRLEWPKNVDTVLRGFALYLKTDPGAVLHVVGDGEAREPLTQIAGELLPPDSFQFHGYLSNADLRQVYDRCDVFALLTLDEPFGMVYPEAAARGLLIIGPDHGGPVEILEGGELGDCIDAFDPEALSESLQRVRGMGAPEADRRRADADRSCRARFGEERVERRLFAALGLPEPG